MHYTIELIVLFLIFLCLAGILLMLHKMCTKINFSQPNILEDTKELEATKQRQLAKAYLEKARIEMAEADTETRFEGKESTGEMSNLDQLRKLKREN